MTDLLELGATGLRHYGGVLDEEWHRELQGPEGVKLYPEMEDNAAVIGAFSAAQEFLVRQVKWRIDPADDTPGAEAGGKFVSECWRDMDSTPDTFLSELLTASIYGWSYFEILYKLRRGPEQVDARLRSEFDDGRINRLARFLGALAGHARSLGGRRSRAHRRHVAVGAARLCRGLHPDGEVTALPAALAEELPRGTKPAPLGGSLLSLPEAPPGDRGGRCRAQSRWSSGHADPGRVLPALGDAGAESDARLLRGRHRQEADRDSKPGGRWRCSHRRTRRRHRNLRRRCYRSAGENAKKHDSFFFPGLHYLSADLPGAEKFRRQLDAIRRHKMPKRRRTSSTPRRKPRTRAGAQAGALGRPLLHVDEPGLGAHRFCSTA